MILIHNLNQSPGCRYCMNLVQVDATTFTCNKKENINKYFNNRMEFCPNFSTSDNSTVKIAVENIKIDDADFKEIAR